MLKVMMEHLLTKGLHEFRDDRRCDDAEDSARRVTQLEHLLTKGLHEFRDDRRCGERGERGMRFLRRFGFGRLLCAAPRQRQRKNVRSNVEIAARKHVLLTKPRALAEAIGATLVVDPRTVEIYQLLAAEHGIKVGFTVYSVDRGVEDMVGELNAKHKELKLLMSNHWQLKRFPASEFDELSETEKEKTFEALKKQQFRVYCSVQRNTDKYGNLKQRVCKIEEL